jgi:hypothetical protein
MADGYGSLGMSLPSGLATGRMRVRALFISDLQLGTRARQAEPLPDLLRWPADAPMRIGVGVGMHAAAAREPETFAGGMALRSPARAATARHV